MLQQQWVGGRQFRRGFLFITLLMLTAWYSQPEVLSSPNPPNLADEVIQLNMTGVLEDLTILSDDSFISVGAMTVQSSNETHLSITPRDGLIIKYTANAGYAWHRTVDEEDAVWLHGIASDGNAAYVVGERPGTNRTLVAAYDTDGSLLWITNLTLGGSGLPATLRGISAEGDELVIAGSATYDGFSRNVILNMDKNGGLVQYRITPDGSGWWGIISADSSSFFVSGVQVAAGCMSRVEGSVNNTLWNVCAGNLSTSLYSADAHTSNMVSAGYRADSGGGYSAALINRSSTGSLNWAINYRPGTTSHVGSDAATLADKIYLVGTKGLFFRDEALGYLIELPQGAALTTMFTNKYVPDGILEWNVEYGAEIIDVYNDFALGAKVDSQDRLVLVGGRVTSTGHSASPVVLRYDNI